MRIAGGPRYDDLLLFAAAAAALMLVLRLRPAGQAAPGPAIESDLSNELLESAGPAVLAFTLDGGLLYMNSSDSGPR